MLDVKWRRVEIVLKSTVFPKRLYANVKHVLILFYRAQSAAGKSASIENDVHIIRHLMYRVSQN